MRVRMMKQKKVKNLLNHNLYKSIWVSLFRYVLDEHSQMESQLEAHQKARQLKSTIIYSMHSGTLEPNKLMQQS